MTGPPPPENGERFSKPELKRFGVPTDNPFAVELFHRAWQRNKSTHGGAAADASAPAGLPVQPVELSGNLSDTVRTPDRSRGLRGDRGTREFSPKVTVDSTGNNWTVTDANHQTSNYTFERDSGGRAILVGATTREGKFTSPDHGKTMVDESGRPAELKLDKKGNLTIKRDDGVVSLGVNGTREVQDQQGRRTSYEDGRREVTYKYTEDKINPEVVTVKDRAKATETVWKTDDGGKTYSDGHRTMTERQIDHLTPEPRRPGRERGDGDKERREETVAKPTTPGAPRGEEGGTVVRADKKEETDGGVVKPAAGGKKKEEIAGPDHPTEKPSPPTAKTPPVAVVADGTDPKPGGPAKSGAPDALVAKPIDPTAKPGATSPLVVEGGDKKIPPVPPGDPLAGEDKKKHIVVAAGGEDKKVVPIPGAAGDEKKIPVVVAGAGEEKKPVVHPGEEKKVPVVVAGAGEEKKPVVHPGEEKKVPVVVAAGGEEKKPPLSPIEEKKIPVVVVGTEKPAPVALEEKKVPVVATGAPPVGEKVLVPPDKHVVVSAAGEDKKLPPPGTLIQPLEDKKHLMVAGGQTLEDRKGTLPVPGVDDRKVALAGAVSEERKVPSSDTAADERRRMMLLAWQMSEERRGMGPAPSIVAAEKKESALPFVAAMSSGSLARNLSDGGIAALERGMEQKLYSSMLLKGDASFLNAMGKFGDKDLATAGGLILAGNQRDLLLAGAQGNGERGERSRMLANQILDLDKGVMAGLRLGNQPGSQREDAGILSALMRGERVGRLNALDALGGDKLANQSQYPGGNPTGGILIGNRADRAEAILNNPTAAFVKWEPTTPNSKQTGEAVRVVAQDLRPVELGTRTGKNSQIGDIQPIETKSNNNQNAIVAAANATCSNATGSSKSQTSSSGTSGTNNGSATNSNPATNPSGGNNPSGVPMQPYTLPNVQLGTGSNPQGTGQSAGGNSNSTPNAGPSAGTPSGQQGTGTGQSTNAPAQASCGPGQSTDPSGQTSQGTYQSNHGGGKGGHGSNQSTPGSGQASNSPGQGSTTVGQQTGSASDPTNTSMQGPNSTTMNPNDPSSVQVTTGQAAPGVGQVQGANANPANSETLPGQQNSQASHGSTSSSGTTSNEGAAQTGQTSGSTSNSDLNNAGTGQNVQNSGQVDSSTPGSNPNQTSQGHYPGNSDQTGPVQVGPYWVNLGGMYEPVGRRNNVLSELGFDLAMLLLGLAQNSGSHSSNHPNIWTQTAPPVGFNSGNVSAFPNTVVDVVYAPTPSNNNDPYTSDPAPPNYPAPSPEPSPPDSGYFDNPTYSGNPNIEAPPTIPNVGSDPGVPDDLIGGGDSGYIDDVPPGDPYSMWSVPYSGILSGAVRYDTVRGGHGTAASDEVGMTADTANPISPHKADIFATSAGEPVSYQGEVPSEESLAGMSQHHNAGRLISLATPDQLSEAPASTFDQIPSDHIQGARSLDVGNGDIPDQQIAQAPSLHVPLEETSTQANADAVTDQVNQPNQLVSGVDDLNNAPGQVPNLLAEVPQVDYSQPDPSQMPPTPSEDNSQAAGSYFGGNGIESGAADQSVITGNESRADQRFEGDIGQLSSTDGDNGPILIASDVSEHDMLSSGNDVVNELLAGRGDLDSTGTLTGTEDQEEEEKAKKRAAEEERKERERAKEREKERARREKEEKEQEDKRLAELFLLEEARRLEDEKQRLYIVQYGDSLESIAKEQFEDQFLAALIYDLNANKIPVENVEGETVYVLEEGMVLLLPSQRQIREWAPMRLANWGQYKTGKATKAVEIEPDPGAKKRRENIEKYLGPLMGKPEEDPRPHVIVRLGDTLSSIAANHPSLNDAALWPLLAQVNNLSVATDDLGAPLAVLKRGQSLLLPDRSQISQFRLSMREAARVSAPRQGIRAAIMKHGLEISNNDRTQHLPTDKQNQLDQIKERTVMDKAAMVNNLIEKLGVSCRIVSSTSAPGTPQSLLAQLEVLTQDRWFPIVTYEVHQDVSIRRELKSGGQWTTTSIEMPAATAQVFLDNDFRTNWERYASRVLSEAFTQQK